MGSDAKCGALGPLPPSKVKRLHRSHAPHRATCDAAVGQSALLTDRYLKVVVYHFSLAHLVFAARSLANR